MDWQPQRQDMGEWNIEIRMEELGGLMSSDPNGWQDGVDAVVHLVDNDGPVITSIQLPSSLEPNEPLNFSMEWTTSEDETYTGSVAVDHEGIEVANKTIVATQANNASLMFTTDGWSLASTPCVSISPTMSGMKPRRPSPKQTRLRS